MPSFKASISFSCILAPKGASDTNNNYLGDAKMIPKGASLCDEFGIGDFVVDGKGEVVGKFGGDEMLL